MESNPLALPYPWWYEIYERIKLAPWWFKYKLGLSKQARLQDEIVELALELGLQDIWVKNVLRFAITEFSKKGLGVDYYGYHNIDHELEATYFTLLVASGMNSRLSKKDIYYLFLSALFHDFDPLKEFDRPNESAVEYFMRNSKSIKRFIEYVGLNMDIVIAMIYRTAYPFVGKIKEDALTRIYELLDAAGVNDINMRSHYLMLGHIVSLVERIAGYIMRDEDGVMELAMKNAHSLGWHPHVINKESIKYFNSILEDERDMLELVLSSIDDRYRERLFKNIDRFREAYNKELEAKEMIKHDALRLYVNVEHEYKQCVDSLLRLHKMLPLPLRMKNDEFIDVLKDDSTILLTLRVDPSDSIVGYCKGSALENYRLRRGTYDENKGKGNTVYLEPISIDYPYWGINGGHLLRYRFILEAKARGYMYLTAYAHRRVIEERISKGEPIEVICRYNPDRYDYYRYDLRAVDESYIRRAIDLNVNTY